MEPEDCKKFEPIDLIEAKASFIGSYRKFLITHSLLDSHVLNEEYEQARNILHKFFVTWNVMRTVKTENHDLLFNKIIRTYRESQDFSIDLVDTFLYDLRTEATNLNLPTVNNIISLCSKAFFIYKPSIYYPLDNLAKNALSNLGYNNSSGSYNDFNNSIVNFKKDYSELILKIQTDSESEALLIEQSVRATYNFDFTDIENIRKNRIIDKLLWTKGKCLKPDNLYYGTTSF
jgi:hypothetical protein